MANVKVLFVMGCERGGSTIAGRLLAQIDGWFGGGETRVLWRDIQYDTEAAKCSCGLALSVCPVWAPVAVAARERSGGLSPAEILALQARVVGHAHSWSKLPRLLRAHPTPAPGDMARYGDIVGAVFSGVAENTGCRVIVDTSKEPTDAVLLSMTPAIDLYVLHLVRDPRGVVYSTYRLANAALDADSERDPRASRVLNAGHMSGHWLIRNASAQLVARGPLRGRVLQLSYEGVVGDPATALRTVAAFVGDEGARLPRIEGNAVEMGPTHNVAGNRSRFRSGMVEMRPDVEWVENLHHLDHGVATAISLPLLRRYGYPLRRP